MISELFFGYIPWLLVGYFAYDAWKRRKTVEPEEWHAIGELKFTGTVIKTKSTMHIVIVFELSSKLGRRLKWNVDTEWADAATTGTEQGAAAKAWEMGGSFPEQATMFENDTAFKMLMRMMDERAGIDKESLP